MAQPQTTHALGMAKRATKGSAGLDLSSTTRLVLTPRQGVQVVETDFHGPLPKETVGIILGHGTAALKGLIVHPGVVDSDYTGVVKIMVSSPTGITAISPGDKIAQLLLLPSLHSQFPCKNKDRGNKAFGSSGDPGIYLALNLDQRPVVSLTVEGKVIIGLLDTGADRSIISSRDWPRGWPLQQSAQTLQGLGYAKAPQLSARELSWRNHEGQSGLFQPYVLEVPISLWGHDLLEQMGFQLTNEVQYSPQSYNIMQRMGHVPGKGLGKQLQGRVSPVIASKHSGMQGLGFP